MPKNIWDIKEGKQTPEVVKQLQEYYSYLNKNRNAIIEEMEKEESRKMPNKWYLMQKKPEEKMKRKEED